MDAQMDAQTATTPELATETEVRSTAL